MRKDRAPSRKDSNSLRRCAVYTRVSTDSGLEQDFNSLDNQREACDAYIRSQAQEGWRPIRDRFDDGGFSGGSIERPALQKLLEEIRARRIDVVVVYKIDRLTRSLSDFAKLVELFDAHEVSIISVTQAFNTTTSMGRLTLNMLLSFAQFEREITGERIRDKVAASKRKGIWMGGAVPLGYRVENRALHIVEAEADIVRMLFQRYLELGSVVRLKAALVAEAIVSPIRVSQSGKTSGGRPMSRGCLYGILSNPIYLGRLRHKGLIHEGLFARSRNMNYVGEVLIYAGYAIISGFTLPWLINSVYWFGLFLPSMLNKDKSLSRYPQWAEYKKSSGLFFPKFL